MDPRHPIVIERFEPGLWAFVAKTGDVQIGWCRKVAKGWVVEDMDHVVLAGPFPSRFVAEREGQRQLAAHARASNPGS